MMAIRFETKKALRDRVKAGKLRQLYAADVIVETSLFGPELRDNGTFAVVGPSPYVRRWYAQITVKNGIIVSVK